MPDRAASAKKVDIALEELLELARPRENLGERALLAYNFRRRMPSEAVGYNAKAAYRGRVQRALTELVPKPAAGFQLSNEQNWLVMTSASQFAAWVLSHSVAPAPTRIPMVKIVRGMEWLKIPRGAVTGLEVQGEQHEAASGDVQTGRTTAPVYLLESGDTVSRWHRYIEESDLKWGPAIPFESVARLLGLPSA